MTNFRQQLWQYLMDKKGDRGMTLVELLVVIFIVGILSSIALPTFFRQADKAKEVEAIQNVSNFGKWQQVNYIEKSAFTTNFGVLNFAANIEETEYEGILAMISGFLSPYGEFNSRESDNYIYAILTVGDDLALHLAISKNSRWQTYATAVYPEDGDIKVCQPTEPIPVSLSSPIPDLLEFLGNILEDPSAYTDCPSDIIPPLPL